MRSQTYSDWELIIWDDASTDGSRAIVESYDDPRVRYVYSNEKVSLGEARNRAMALATGEWIAFIDQDDLWLPNKLQDQIALADVSDDSVNLIYGRTVMFRADGSRRDYDHRHEFRALPEGDILLKLFTDSCFICMSSAILRKSALELIGDIPSKYEVISDYFLFVSLAAVGQAKAIQHPICHYRKHADNMTRHVMKPMAEETLLLLNQFRNSLPMPLLQHRQRIAYSLIALAELPAPAGLNRLFAQGSFGFLSSRPWLWSWRAIRRTLEMPRWRAAKSAVEASRTTTSRDTESPEFSFVIVTYNAASDIENCLESIQQELGQRSHEIFIVDNASTDGTARLIKQKFPHVHLLPSKANLWFSSGNNRVLPDCNGHYIVLLNPDTVVEPDAIRTMAEYLDQHSDVGMVGPRLILDDGSTQVESARPLPRLFRLLGWLAMLDKVEWMVRFKGSFQSHATHPPKGTWLDRFSLLSWARDQPCRVESICGACMMLRGDVQQNVGLLDALLPMYLDDIDYCKRVRDAGYDIAYLPQAEVRHLWQQSTSQAQGGALAYVRGCQAIQTYLAKHHGKAEALAFRFAAMLISPVRVALCWVMSLAAQGESRSFWYRQYQRSLGLFRWSWFMLSPWNQSTRSASQAESN